MDYASSWARALRRIGQRAGILRPAVRLYRKLLKVDYEAAFDKGTQERVRPGDTVWDVGANIGHYCAGFSRLAGPGGRVIAIEPSPSSLPQLQACVADCANVEIRNIALSNEDGEASFFVSAHADSVIEGLSRASVGADAREIRVPVLRGDTLAESCRPNVIKIDVEGFEVEVLEGLPRTLASRALHTVAIEVHFDTLARRGRVDGPRELSDTLTAAGFAIRWTDPSHLIASKPFPTV